MNAKTKRELIWIIAGAAAFIAAFGVSRIFEPLPWYALTPIFLMPYLIAGGEVLLSAAHGVIRGRLFDENFLMTVASLGAFVIGEQPEAVLVMLLYRVGELLQSVAVGKSRDSVSALIDIGARSVHLETENGVVEVDPEEVRVGDIMLVRAGERIPIDGTVVEGNSSVNTAALTGESLPVDVAAGDRVISGSINSSGVLRVRADCEYENSTVARMLELIEGAAANKSKSEKFITRFARVYTPAVVAFAVLIAIVPSLVLGGWKEHIYRALNFLVISCPCALVISVPLTFFGGIGAASRNGILVKCSNCFEALYKCGTAVFDKTGTLTRGSFRIANIVPAGGADEDELLYKAACAERYSTHPIAECVVRGYSECGSAKPLMEADFCEERAGRGVKARFDPKTLLVGNSRLMEEAGVSVEQGENVATVIHIAEDGEYLGRIEIEDELKKGAAEAVDQLKTELGIKTVILSGDRALIAEKIASLLDVNEVYAELLPQDKVSTLERIIGENGTNATTIYIGDGINDAPVLARADVGFAMGALGSDAAIEAADVVLTDDDIARVPLAVHIAKRTVGIAKQNIILAFGVKLLVLVLGALGYAEMWMALIADVGVCLAAVFNAMRAMRVSWRVNCPNANDRT